MVLKTKIEQNCSSNDVYEYLNEIEWTDNISYVKVKSGFLTGGWNNKEGKWEDPNPISSYEYIYLMSDNGQTIERIK